jgi:hypothetical protein
LPFYFEAFIQDRNKLNRATIAVVLIILLTQAKPIWKAAMTIGVPANWQTGKWQLPQV